MCAQSWRWCCGVIVCEKIIFDSKLYLSLHVKSLQQLCCRMLQNGQRRPAANRNTGIRSIPLLYKRQPDFCNLSTCHRRDIYDLLCRCQNSNHLSAIRINHYSINLFSFYHSYGSRAEDASWTIRWWCYQFLPGCQSLLSDVRKSSNGSSTSKIFATRKRIELILLC